MSGEVSMEPWLYSSFNSTEGIPPRQMNIGGEMSEERREVPNHEWAIVR